MGRYVIRRLIQLPWLIIGITLVVFALVHLTPGSPVDEYRLDPNIKPADLESLKKTLGIDKPLPEQYITWVSQLAHGNMGISLKTYRPVRQTLQERVGNTLVLTVTALILSLLVAVPVGVLSAIRRNTLFDYIATVFSTLGQAIPSFWLGLLLILLFAVQFQSWGLPWLPSGGTQTLPHGGDTLDRAKHLILPALTLSLTQVARWIRYIRGQMLEVLNQDYVRTARAKGVDERTVLMRHAFRNASLPLITLVGLDIPVLFAGATITETIFSWPGVGSFVVESARNRDYTVVMGLTLFFAVVTVFSTLLADIFYGVADPRVQYE
jgi:peptide/nickel transport system permease protein